MDFTKESINPNPRDRCSYLGILFFTYTWEIFKKGYTKVLQIEDLYNPIRSDRSTLLGDRLERVWNGLYEKFKETRKKPNLIWCLVRTFWIEYSLLGTVLVFSQFFAVVQPLMLGQLLSYFRPNSEMSKSDALWYAGAISFCTFTQALFSNQYLMMGFHYGMKVRAAACALIYRKSLRLSMTALGETAAGKIVNLLSNDVSRFDLVTIFLHHMWTAPLLTLIITYFMWIDVGWAGLVGIMTVFLIVPLQGYTGKLSAIYRKATALKTDERVRLMDEIISGIRVIKMYAWERPFDRLLKMARKSEVKIITKTSYVRGLYMAFNLFTTRVAMFTTLLTLTLTDYQALNASRVFLVLSYLNIVSQTMSQMFVRGISEIAELIVAIKRLEEFMLNEEFNSLKSLTTATPVKNNNDAIKVDLVNLTAKWNDTSTDNVLEAVTLRAHRGDLIGIIGPVGCGKSAILLSILGELNVVTGDIKIDGLVSYAAQESWVFAATVRQNILFGQEFDKNRYFDVVRACALERDFEQFSNGDLTIVGDRGASLSGGQKARINLARAIYRQADIYLLDDPLSAVDIHIGKHLYDQCINGFLANKTRILVTHQVDLLKNCQNIVILNNGRIENEGTFAALSQSDNIYAKLLLTNESFDQPSDMSNALVKRERKLSLKSVKSLASALSELSIPESLLAETEPELDEVDDPKHVSMERQIDMKNYHEESSKGKINGNLFWLYFAASGNLILAFIVLALFLLTEAAVMSTDWFVSFWINFEDTKRQVAANQTLTEMTDIEEDNFWQPTTFLKIQGILVVIVLIFGLTRSLLFYKLAMISSQKLHDRLFKSVINATMRFFDTNSTGRILNRFAKDIGSIDELLPKVILDASQLILLSIGSVILITIVNAYFLALVAIIGIFSLIFRHVYLKSSKNVKRLEGVVRSPVFTHLNATLNGLTTVRAFSAQSILRQEFDRYQDGHTSAWFMFIALSSSFGLYMDLLCVAFVTCVTFSFLILSDVTGGQAGLAITQAMTLTMLVQWGLRQSAEVANHLMSVERVLEYAQLPCERDTQNNKLSKTWPENGKIHFQDTGLRYDKNDDSLVLKNLTLTVNACEKVGIVGRTGAGKSSLISALFRLADDLLGDICIDDVSTSDVPLSVLRSKISIIPQDPVLFSGTLRYNLDPFEQYADDVLYAALREVELLSSAQHHHGGVNDAGRLESHVMDGGANYSVGQRQLICLARAIIRQNKILLLDEATASVDPQTDALIQKTIRKKFANCTVLTVAHRLNTIMDSDKVLVMGQGQVVEFEHPHLLLQQPNGVFLNMVEETGQSMCAQLKKIAKESYLRRSTLLEENLKLEK